MESIWSEYLSSITEQQSTAVQTVLKQAKEYIPGAEAAMSYAMPTWKSGGKSIVSVAAWKNHLAIYPHGMKPAQLVAGDLKHGVVDKSAIKYNYNHLPRGSELKTIVDAKLKSLSD